MRPFQIGLRENRSYMLIHQIENIKPINLFLGAGISRLAPAYAPIWREMQIGLCQALFDKMKSERWDVFDVESEVEQLRRFNFRPETFWERVLNHTSIDFVSNALGIVNVGQPNLNHKVIGELCHKGIVNNIVTTNFDEYLERTLPADYSRIIDQQIAPVSSKKLYLKLHGTISALTSLQFTLKHTKQLPPWKEDLLGRCLENRPLVIAGYSGYDDDIMPCLLRQAPQIPRIIVIRYPAASPDEPIMSLAKFPQTQVIEADFSKETEAWADGQTHALKKLAAKFTAPYASKAPDLELFYRQAINRLDVPQVPFLVSLLFELAANRELTKKYAWLADDACNDERYRTSESFKREVKVHLSKVVASNDSELSSLLMGQAHEIYPHDAAPVANSIMEHVDRVFEYFFAGPLSSAQEKEIEQYALGALTMLNLGAIHGEGILFRAGWCMGRLRMRQERLPESIQYYVQALKGLPEGLDDVQKGSFLLDCGLAALKGSVINQEDELLATAITVLSEAERIALNISDHMTAAKAMMNLSNCYIFTGQFDLSIQKVKDAQRLAMLTGDLGLQMRAVNLETQLIQMIAQLREQAGS